MSEAVISVRNLEKTFKVYSNHRERLFHALNPARQKGCHEVRALNQVSFEVFRGEAVAVIGRNGGGKSTLLEILTGTLVPTTGEIELAGRISALLELGSGFNPELSGRDNVILNGLLLGCSRAEILRRFDEIVDFAEIGDALERPLKTYSSGMMMRLAFAVQVLIEPDILIIDEALSVGDFFFQQKCYSRLRNLREKGLTLLFVSHDMGIVRDLCSRALYFRQGHLIYAGDTQHAVRLYLAEGSTRQHSAQHAGDFDYPLTDDADQVRHNSIWSRPIADRADKPGQIIAVALYDEEEEPATAIRMGTKLVIKVLYQPASEVTTHVGITIRNRFDHIVSVLSSYTLGMVPPRSGVGEMALFEVIIDMYLEAGNYSLTVATSLATAPNRGELMDSTPALGPLAILWDYDSEPAPFLGMVGLPSQGAFKKIPATGMSENDVYQITGTETVK